MRENVGMRSLALFGFLVVLTGCGKKEPLHNGQPAAYWRQALVSTDAGARLEAANALAALKAKDSVPDLMIALKDKDDQVRAAAAEALWSLGPDARDAVAALILLLKDKSASVRLNAAGALGDVGADVPEALSALRETLKDRDADVRVQAATSLGRSRSEAVVVDLIAALKDNTSRVRVAAAYALAEIGPGAKAALPTLQAASKASDGDFRTAIAYAIAQIEGKE
jgi:HEAT repeat protein